MTDVVKPALTPEEWARLNRESVTRLAWGNPGTSDPDFCGTPDPFSFVDGMGEYSNSLAVRPERRHALAALALHGQPFGFSREDVARLRAIQFDSTWGAFTEDSALEFPTLDEASQWADTLAARIEALLPPEDPQL